MIEVGCLYTLAMLILTLASRRDHASFSFKMNIGGMYGISLDCYGYFFSSIGLPNPWSCEGDFV
jgi:hypothetical protein